MLESDFTVGFEIEGIAFEPNYQKIKDVLRDYSKKGQNGERVFSIGGDTSIVIDQDIDDLSEYEVELPSGETTYFKEKIVPFEVDAGYFTSTPKNKEDFMNLLLSIYFEGMMSNPTCSLHLHIKPKNTELRSLESRLYATMFLAYIVESEVYEDYLYFNRDLMSNEKWSSVEAMYEEYFEFKKEFSKKKDCIFTEKYKYRTRGLFHVHEQGTLEWRGNRGFFDYNPVMFSHKSLKVFEDNIVNHIKFMYKFIGELKNAANGKVNIPKEDSIYWQLFDLKNQTAFQSKL